MLVLSRRLNEAIQIGDGITIRILKVKGRSVRLGIEAPRSVRVLRSELPQEVDLAGLEPLLAASACVDWEPEATAW